MAANKAKPAAPAPKKAATPAAPAERATNRPDAAVASSGESNRLLREAAWSRMFGRVESKNPFTR